MRIGILSDVHDHVWNLARALNGLRESDVLFCCGDLCSPFIVSQLAEGFAGPIHIVFGNNDGDQFRIAQVANKFGARVKLHGEFAEIPADLYGFRGFINHYPRIAKTMALSGLYDLVCYGHDHSSLVSSTTNGGWLVNPGAVMGYDPMAGRDIAPTVAVYETESREARLITIPELEV